MVPKGGSFGNGGVQARDFEAGVGGRGAIPLHSETAQVRSVYTVQRTVYERGYGSVPKEAPLKKGLFRSAIWRLEFGGETLLLRFEIDASWSLPRGIAIT